MTCFHVAHLPGRHHSLERGPQRSANVSQIVYVSHSSAPSWGLKLVDILCGGVWQRFCGYRKKVGTMLGAFRGSCIIDVSLSPECRGSHSNLEGAVHGRGQRAPPPQIGCFLQHALAMRT